MDKPSEESKALPKEDPYNPNVPAESRGMRSNISFLQNLPRPQNPPEHATRLARDAKDKESCETTPKK